MPRNLTRTLTWRENFQVTSEQVQTDPCQAQMGHYNGIRHFVAGTKQSGRLTNHSTSTAAEMAAITENLRALIKFPPRDTVHVTLRDSTTAI